LETIELGLKLKFGTKGMAIYPKILKVDNVEKLKAIKESIIIGINNNS